MSETTIIHQKEISRKLSEYSENEQWQQAKELLESELQKHPADHWLNAQLGEVYYEMRDYNQAIVYTQQAVNQAPDCPLALNNHAVLLYMHERYTEAQEIWERLLNQDFEQLLSNPCSESKQNLLSLLNDTRFRLGDTHKALNDNHKALKYYNQHLQNRKRGLFSNFTKKEILEEIRFLNDFCGK